MSNASGEAAPGGGDEEAAREDVGPPLNTSALVQAMSTAITNLTGKGPSFPFAADRDAPNAPSPRTTAGGHGAELETADGADTGGSEPESRYADLNEFLRDWLLLAIERRLIRGSAHGVRWCPKLSRHPEALSRLHALWEAWEAARVDKSGSAMSTWWRDHCDHHLTMLTATNGPFARCGIDSGHTDPTGLPAEPLSGDVLRTMPQRVRGGTPERASTTSASPSATSPAGRHTETTSPGSTGPVTAGSAAGRRQVSGAA